MCARIGKGFVLVIAVAFSVLGGCEETTDPEVGVSTPIGIAHLSIGPMEIEGLVNVEDPGAIADVLAVLSEEEIRLLAEGGVICVEDPRLTLEIAKTVGLDTSPHAVTEGGILMAAVHMTWGQLKCCYAGNAACCTKKKEQ